MGFDVVVLGSANVDMILKVDRYPVGGETVSASAIQEVAGGKGLNQAIAASRAGARTAFVGAVGADASGRRLLETLRKEHIDVSAVRTVEAPTGRAIVVVQPSGENTIFVVPGANASVALGPEARRVLTSGKVVVAQLEVPVPIVTEGLAVARQAGASVMLNAAPAVPLQRDFLDGVDLLVVNEHEAVMLGEHAQPLDAAGVLSRSVGSTIVTMGADGAALVTRSGTVERVPGVPAAAVDTTAAGDTFVGFFAASVAAGATASEALRLAVVAGALAVEAAGAVPSIPTRAQTLDRLTRSAAT